tara:strand:+ start:2661 stop:3428 length:768 start_codon:yes stop_codon:yes gene_type:complete
MANKPTLLIDGDVALYHCTKAVEEEYHWGNDLWSLVSDAGEAKTILNAWIRNIKDHTGGDRVVMTLSGLNNWRKDILPTYKLHRKVHRKPLAFLPMRNHIMDNFETYYFDNLEGDDVLGLLAGGWQDIEGDKIVVTIDKDLRTIPGLHYNPQKPDEGVVEVDDKEADYNHLLQSLMGDATDGYSGCPGIGPKRAARLLSTPTWDVVVQAYENAGLCEEEALVQARVARILRYGEYDIDNQEVILWTPKECVNEQG